MEDLSEPKWLVDFGQPKGGRGRGRLIDVEEEEKTFGGHFPPKSHSQSSNTQQLNLELAHH